MPDKILTLTVARPVRGTGVGAPGFAVECERPQPIEHSAISPRTPNSERIIICLAAVNSAFSEEGGMRSAEGSCWRLRSRDRHCHIERDGIFQRDRNAWRGFQTDQQVVRRCGNHHSQIEFSWSDLRPRRRRVEVTKG